jgi:RNA polymerase sigma-70 factor (ECF subfamily)
MARSTDLRSDADLVIAAIRDDQTALEDLFRRYRKNCFAVALSILKNEADAEEAAHQSLWHAFQRLEECRDPARFGSWLRRIVVTQSLCRLRREKFRRHLPLDDYLDQAIIPSPEAIYDSLQVSMALRREVSYLPRILKQPLVLRDLENQPSPIVWCPKLWAVRLMNCDRRHGGCCC